VGITFVFVTHDQEEALTMSDRIAVFNDGRVEQVATPTELYERPATAFVAGFVGTSNLLTGAEAERVLGVTGSAGIRPEKLRLHHVDADGRPTEPVDDGEQEVRGVVVEVAYLGASTHSVVDVGGGVLLTVQEQNQRRSVDHTLARRGEPVLLTWRPEHVVRLGSAEPAQLGDPQETGSRTRE
jgi:putative spermidine/putrescine transport system ATP-binding protein